MAIGFTDYGLETDASGSKTHSSVSPPAGTVLILCAGAFRGSSTNPGAITIGGTGPTWTEIPGTAQDDTAGTARALLRMYVGVATGGSIAPSVSSSGGESVCVGIVGFTSASASITNANSGSNTGGDPSRTLSPAPAATSATFMFNVLPGDNDDMTFGSGLTELWDTAVGTTSRYSAGYDITSPGSGGSGTSASTFDVLSALIEVAAGSTTSNLLADDVATPPPTAGSPSIGQAHVLAADDAATAPPTAAQGTLGQVHGLSADDATTAAPTASVAALAQVHGLSADDAAAGAPTLGEPAIGQAHALLADDAASGAPAATAPDIGQVHALAANDAAAGIPTVPSAAVGQTHILAADDAAADPPELTEPVVVEVTAVLADDVASGAPTLGSPDIGQVHVLAADDVASGVPSASIPAIGQTHGLLADDVAAAPPELTEPAVAEAGHSLHPDDVEAAAPVVAVPAIGQIHGLAADDVATSAPTLDAGALGQVHALVADDAAVAAPTVGEATLGQTHALLADDAAASHPVLDEPVVGEGGLALLGDDVEAGAPTVDAAALGQAHALSALGIETGAPIVVRPAIGPVATSKKRRGGGYKRIKKKPQPAFTEAPVTEAPRPKIVRQKDVLPELPKPQPKPIVPPVLSGETAPEPEQAVVIHLFGLHVETAPPVLDRPGMQVEREPKAVAMAARVETLELEVAELRAFVAAYRAKERAAAVKQAPRALQRFLRLAG